MLIVPQQDFDKYRLTTVCFRAINIIVDLSFLTWKVSSSRMLEIKVGKYVAF